ncbi:MAG: UDP-N-acetylmuramoyl-L-alanyl-D-glutamate--2,6-diaminopimelate ligase [Candidatus Omnitrophica bacterium]|nr:UDP-N-acetylmuramoyl-L-alanyl-D-glutamate--2,6-diaminopimelate ligase [Candidatus Omnitrophota bacterium]
MTTLGTLLSNFEVSLSQKELLLPVPAVSCDSKQVREGDLFVAVKGATTDGASYIPEALSRGARIIVAEKDFPSESGIVKVVVKDSRHALALLANRFYENPSEKLRVIGITGTNGKTTASYLIESVLQKAGYGVGVIGTIAHRVGTRAIPAQNTTPGPPELQSLLSQMVKEKLTYAVMEVSSHALDQKRVETIRFDAALFMNLTQDHLDYHKTQEAYFQAKRRLFESLDEKSTAILNADSPFCERMIRVTRGRHLTYGLHERADIYATPPQTSSSGSCLDVTTPAGPLKVTSRLIGLHNVYNTLAAIGTALSQRISLPLIQEGVQALSGVPGRLERIDAGQPFRVFVDFAHTEDALQQVLASLRPLTARRILLVFGCGGDRDRLKRPQMAKVASELSDLVIVTSDNPRKEDPRAILKEIETGFPPDFHRYHLEEDRAKAIEKALYEAEEGDTVLIAGKGHEAYQIFKDRTIPFDDRQVAYEILYHSRIAQGHGGAASPQRG